MGPFIPCFSLLRPLCGEESATALDEGPCFSSQFLFMGLSYLLWFFSGSFTLLIVSRIMAGIMGGNISVCSAVVADVTDQSNRSRGMAVIGIAFALGLVLGPALGGLLSLVRFDLYFPSLTSVGVNPFSAPALLAALLSLINFICLLKVFKETLPEDERKRAKTHRTVNILNMFSFFGKDKSFRGVYLTNMAYFLFILSFSGVEFTLAFLSSERFAFSAKDNALMFVFIGVILALVQGSLSRKRFFQNGGKTNGHCRFLDSCAGICACRIMWVGTDSLRRVGLFGLWMCLGHPFPNGPCLPLLRMIPSRENPWESSGLLEHWPES